MMKPSSSTRALVIMACGLAFGVLSGCTKAIGIKPVQPGHGKKIAGDSLVLEWEEWEEPDNSDPFHEKDLPEKPPPPPDDVHYQLLIQDLNDKVVYQQLDIDATRHEVNADLSPGKYRWAVRPLFLRDGEWEPGAWNSREWAYFLVIFISSGHGPYEFNLLDGIEATPEESEDAARDVSLRDSELGRKYYVVLQ